MLRSLQKSALALVMVLGGELFGEWYRSHFFAHLCTLDWSYYHEITIQCKECKGVDICSLRNWEISIQAVCCWQDIDSVLFWMLCILIFCFRHTFFSIAGSLLSRCYSHGIILCSLYFGLLGIWLLLYMKQAHESDYWHWFLRSEIQLSTSRLVSEWGGWMTESMILFECYWEKRAR